VGQEGLGYHRAVSTHMAGRVAWCRGEWGDAAADLGGECAALCTLMGGDHLAPLGIMYLFPLRHRHHVGIMQESPNSLIPQI